MTDRYAQIREALAECRDIAMEWTMRGRIPECGKFGEIAQDLDAVCAELATLNLQPSSSMQPVATAFFTEKGEVAFTGLFDRTLKALEAVKTTRMGISSGSIDLYAAPQPAAVDEAMVKRFLEAFQKTPGDEAIGADEKVARRWLTAALSQPAEQRAEGEA